MCDILQDRYAKQLALKYIHVLDDEMTHRLIANGKYAILGSILDFIFFPEDNIKNEDLKVRRESPT